MKSTQDVASTQLGEFELHVYSLATWREHERQCRAVGLYNLAVAMQRFADCMERMPSRILDIEWLDRGIFDAHGPPSGFDPLPFEVA